MHIYDVRYPTEQLTIEEVRKRLRESAADAGVPEQVADFVLLNALAGDTGDREMAEFVAGCRFA